MSPISITLGIQEILQDRRIQIFLFPMDDK